jgi:TrmH family RNA methyltransferase
MCLSFGKYLLVEHEVKTNSEIKNTSPTFDDHKDMLSKNFIKHIKALSLKKKRIEEGLFIVEGTKSVIELLRSKITVKTLIATSDWYEHNYSQLQLIEELDMQEATEAEMHKLSNFATASPIIAVAHIPDYGNPPAAHNLFAIALDTLQDPGNLGTIIRIADWYGIDTVVTTTQSVEWHNPKCIQSTMGSFTRVAVYRTDLETYLAQQQVPIIGAMMKGQPHYQLQLPSSGVLLIGNEGHGISQELQQYISMPLSIPAVGGAESLNAAIATAILCDARARALHKP